MIADTDKFACENLFEARQTSQKKGMYLVRLLYTQLQVSQTNTGRIPCEPRLQHQYQCAEYERVRYHRHMSMQIQGGCSQDSPT